ncbi:carboxylesterase [Holotrichia oblita]|uniref:Carboxylesterase n=1 Tax=Holotrichia oblita TaxID=644536 RepID=A0ACB9TPY7_HOLOL|nr:carboxylesterase [Holotrichia oblita]
MEKVIVQIEEGALKGTTRTDINGRTIYSFLGIPYAKPPVGELRFKAPQPPEKWIGVRNATANGNGCYSRNMLNMITGSEDCLFLNVFTPELPAENTNSLKPVMLWIHGGGYTSGSSDIKVYGPDFLLTEDIVLVTINYRLGVLGFLSLDDQELSVPGNAGCKDIIMALKWVQRNITSFGGDPNNVTVFGESAGGAVVHLLMLSPMAEGLFHKGIAQSGSALNVWSLGKSNSAKQLAEILQCPHTDDKDILNFLQSLPDHSVNLVRPVGPIIEKASGKEPAFLTENPLELILKGKYHKVPLIMGYTSNEGIFFETPEKRKKRSKVVDLERYVPHFYELAKGSEGSKEIANSIQTFYFGDDVPDVEDRERFSIINTDTYFLRGIYTSVRSHSITSKQPIYLYRFSVDARLNLIKKFANISLKGAGHADDLGYLFKTLMTPNLPEDSVEMITVRRFVKLWTNFAKTGDPNPIEGVTWNPVTMRELNFLDIGPELVSDVNPDNDRMTFWNNVEMKMIPS